MLLTAKISGLLKRSRQWLDKRLTDYVIGAIIFPTSPPLSEEQALGFLAEMYQNPSFKRYWDARETYLILQCTELYMQGKAPASDRVAGQIEEVRQMKQRMKAAHGIWEKKRKENKERAA